MMCQWNHCFCSLGIEKAGPCTHALQAVNVVRVNQQHRCFNLAKELHALLLSERVEAT